MTTIARPQDVRIVHPDGSVTPVELTYCGVEDGCHVWSGFAAFTEGWDVLRVGMMPDRTAIRLPIQAPRAGDAPPSRRPAVDTEVQRVERLVRLLGLVAALWLALLLVLVATEVIS